jgi:hypothetical protein
MVGTWLSKQTFYVSPEREDTSFSPEELTDAIRVQFKLPTGTLRYVSVEGALDADTIGDAVHVYVDGVVLNLLLANPNEPLAQQLQIELAIQAMDVVAGTIVCDLREALGRDPSQTDLASYEAPNRFFENLATTLNKSVHEVLNMTTAPGLLRAFLEDAFGALEATTVALKEN